MGDRDGFRKPSACYRSGSIASAFSRRSKLDLQRTSLAIVVEPDYLPIALPKLNIMTVDELFCGLNRRFVVGAVNRK
jgi:hypothetical protein